MTAFAPSKTHPIGRLDSAARLLAPGEAGDQLPGSTPR